MPDCQLKSAQGIVLPTLEKRVKKGIGTMAQFFGQTGSLEKHGNNWTVVAKLVVASLKVNGEEIYKRSWDHEYIDFPIVDPAEQNSEAFTPQQMTEILDAAFEAAVRKPKNVTYMLSLIVAGLGLLIGEVLAIKARDNIGCPNCKALEPRKCQHGTTFSGDCRVLHVRQSVYINQLKSPKTKNGITRC